MDVGTLERLSAEAGGAIPFVPTGKSPDEALAALSAWSVLEALSPRTYGQPKDLVEGLGELVSVEDGRLPWHEPVQPRNNYDVYYRVSLGSVDMRKASRAILDAFGWDEGTASAQGSHALLGMILLDGRGAPVASGTGVSSFGWALPLVLGKNLGKMSRWGEAENDAVEALNEMLARPDPHQQGKLAPLTWADIGKAHDALVERFGIEPGFVDGPGPGVRFEHRIRPGSVPSPYLMNSFLLAGIERVHRLVSSGATPVALGAYMGLHAPASRIDVLRDRKGLASLLAPGGIPFARWPTPGGHPLVTLQQAAVNAVMARASGEAEEGILAVNGPPGTGKTTMLRDVVAANLVRRAMAMAEAEDPEDLFTQVKLGGRRSLYVLDEALRGFEMVVASSNNKAVENVSREMPQLGSVDAGAGVPRYFGATSDFLAGISLNPKAKPAPAGAGTWGLVSAALGNSSNRAAFMEGFWWNEDHGIRTWLRLAKGEDVKVAVTDGKGKVVGERPPHMLKVENPPRGRPAALAAWKAVRTRFLEAHAKVSMQLDGIAEFERERRRIPELEAELATARAAVDKARQAKDPVLVLAERIEKAKDDLASAQGELERLEASRPRDPSKGSGQVEHDIWAAERDEARLLIEAHQRTVARLERSYQLESGRREDDGGLQAAVAATRVVEDSLARARRRSRHGPRASATAPSTTPSSMPGTRPGTYRPRGWTRRCRPSAATSSPSRWRCTRPSRWRRRGRCYATSPPTPRSPGTAGRRSCALTPPTSGQACSSSCRSCPRPSPPPAACSTACRRNRWAGSSSTRPGRLRRRPPSARSPRASGPCSWATRSRSSRSRPCPSVWSEGSASTSGSTRRPGPRPRPPRRPSPTAPRR